ncbi:MAG: hypothetical protein FGM57_03070 [Candidatus Taylorbacteria bacterium]|nr:hypothetical protein [Candidatus Taylorbacteria bacterium]
MKPNPLNTTALVTADSPKGQRATATFRDQYNKVGLDDESAQRLNENAGFAEYLAEGIRRFSAKAPDYKLAQSILGADFITPEEVMKARTGIVYNDEQITALAESLPSEDMLKWCKENGYAVMPAPPTAMSLLDVREIKSTHFYSETGGWYADQKFAREDKTSFGWLAIKKTPVANSTSKNWNEQSKLLSALEHVPNAAETSWFITTYFEVRGARLFESVYVRTSSLDSDGSRVSVGYFASEGLAVGHWYDGSRVGNVGVASARKVEA